jgi:hypothetical protein
VGSHLRIRYNGNVLSLAGLDKIATVGGELDISNNNKLQNLNGLNALTSAGSNVIVGNNPKLVSLAGLSKLTDMAGYLSISVDTSLTTLAGIDSIDHTGITNLLVVNSKYLTKCNVKSVCDFLAIPSNTATIGGNGFGCMSRTQVENNCAAQTGVGDLAGSKVTVYPNPAASFLVVSGVDDRHARIALTDARGRQVLEQPLGNGYVDVLTLPAGVYTLTVQTEGGWSATRIVKTDP